MSLRWIGTCPAGLYLGTNAGTSCYDRGMTKKALRQQTLAALRAMQPTEKKALDLELLAALLASTAYQKAQVIATYLAMPHEFNTHLVIEQALLDGKEILVPKVVGKGQMVFLPYQPNALEVSGYGLLEPKGKQAVAKGVIDLIHVPGVVFNAAGYRIGYGGGYYDRYLADFKGQTISTIYAQQLAEFSVEAHDIAVLEVLSR